MLVFKMLWVKLADFRGGDALDCMIVDPDGKGDDGEDE